MGGLQRAVTLTEDIVAAALRGTPGALARSPAASLHGEGGQPYVTPSRPVPPDRAPLDEDAALSAMARDLVALVRARRAAGLPAADERRGDMALLKILEGKALQLAIEQAGDQREGFALFGLEHRVDAGNAWRDLRKGG